MKKQFEVGDRVRVYGGIFAKAYSTYKFVRAFDAEIQKVCDAEELAIIGDNDEEYLCHPKQCRRLKPKAKPVKKEPRRLIASFNRLDQLVGIGRPLAKEATLGKFYSDNDCVDFIEFPPGHVLVSRERLAKAWEAAFGRDDCKAANAKQYAIIKERRDAKKTV